MKTYGGQVLALVLLSVVLWASSFIALKLVLQICDPNFLLLGRMIIAAVCALPFYRHLSMAGYVKGDWYLLLGLGVCEPCLYFLFESKALMLTTTGQAGMITALMPVMVALGAWIMFKEKITRQVVLGFALALAGVAALTLGAEATETAPNPALGNFYELMAMVMATGYVLILKKLSKRYTPLFLTTVQSVSGALFFGFLFWISPVPFPARLPVEGWGLIAYLGIFVSFGAYLCYNISVSRMPASRAAAFINLVPVVTLVMGWIFLGEVLSPLQYGAAALIMTGVYLSQKPPARQAPPPRREQPAPSH